MPSAVMTTRRSSGRVSASDDKDESLFRRLHALGFEYGGGVRAREIFDQLLRRVLVFRRRAQARRVSGGVLDFLRQRPNQGGALHRHDLADLVDAELGLAADDEIGDMAALLELGLRLCLLYTSPSPRDRTRSRMPS